MSERETQFQCFAHHLWDEIETLLFQGLDPEAFWDLHIPEKTAEAIETFIAQRAYDFACHVVSDAIGIPSTEKVIDGIRDFTE